MSNALFQQSFRSYYNKIGCQQPYYTQIHYSAARKGIDRNFTLDDNQQLCDLTGAECCLAAPGSRPAQMHSAIGRLTWT